jgi:outer membrane lipoprotein-sorting protein
MKNVFLLCCLLGSGLLWAAGPDEDLLKTVDSLVSYMDTDFSAVYEIVQIRPGQANSTTVAGIYRRDIREQYVIIILDPIISRGQGYLKDGHTLWFYDPESKTFNSTSSRERFQNSNASNSDFTRSTLAEDYESLGGFDEMLGRYKCRMLILQAKSRKVTYPKMKIWVSEDGLVRKMEDYSLSGQLMRTTEIPAYYKIETQTRARYVPQALRITDELRGVVVNGKFEHEQTLITIKNPTFSKVRDSIFSKAYLESVSRR